MEFQINTNNVILIQHDQVESGEYNVTECNFTFASEYDGLTKKAVFTSEDGTAYLQSIVDNKCFIPSEILEVSQVVEIGVYAYDVENEELVLRYSPEPTQFYIHQGSYKEAQNSTPPTPSEIEQLQAQITENANDIDGIIGDIVDINGDITDIKAEQTTQNENIQTNANNISTINGQIVTINADIDNLERTKADKTEIPTKTSDLINDSDFVSDANYVHTDNNFTDEKDAQITTNANNITTLQSTKADKSEIPTKTSQLTNDSGFITKNVDDLANYYKKSETYNKTEIDGKVSSVYKYKGTVATYQDLPSTDLTIGDVYNVEEDGSNYAWTGNAWDKLGGDIDLSEYYTKTQTDSLLSAKANSSDVYTKNETYNKIEVNTLLNDKVDKVDGKGLSTEDFTTAEKTKLAGIEAEANKTVVDDELSSTSTNPVENQVIYASQEVQNARISELEQDVEDLRGACLSVEGTGTDITLNNTAKGRLLKNELSGRTEQATSILPNEYQQVEYIESTGTQYIDTGYSVDSNNFSNFSMEIIMNILTTSNNLALMGTAGDGTGNIVCVGTTAAANGFTCGNGTAIQTNYDLSYNTNKHRFYVNYNNGKFKLDETEKTFTPNVPNTSKSLYLFAYNRTNEARISGTFKLYSCKFYNGNNLVRNLVPCYRISDNEIGMYDTVTNTFLTNAGTGDFIKGSDITSLPTPDFPIPIKNVTGNANVKIQNKNLAWNGWAEDFVSRVNSAAAGIVHDRYERKNVLFYADNTGYGDYENKYIFKTDFKENTQYTFNFDYLKKSNTNGTLAIQYTDGSTTKVTNVSGLEIWENKILVSSPNKTIKYVRAQYAGGTGYIDLDTFMVLEGAFTAETIPSYVPHQEQNFPFTFAEGQRGMQGTQPKDDGINNNRNQVVFDGTENWQIFDLSSTKKQFYLNISTVKHNETTPTVKSNYFIADVIGNRYSNNNVVFSTSNGVAFVTTTMLTLADWKTWVAQKYSNNQPLIAEYNLKEPKIISYNETQQAQYNAIKQARSYDDLTHITSTSEELGFNMAVESLANANNMISTINSRLDLLEG